MKYICSFLLVMLLISCTGCTGSDGSIQTSPEFRSSIPENNDTKVGISTAVEVTFDEVVALATNHGITINGNPADVTASFTKLIFTVDLDYNTTYDISIPKGSVINTFDIPLDQDIQISFTTVEEPDLNKEGMAFVANMGVGWNLGNTLDAHGNDETAWGNPKATQELIDAINAKGFKTIRVPVTWQFHMGDAPDYTIEKEWLDRVEEVVNYGLTNDMYVIVNIHHDEEWIIPRYENVDQVKDQLEKVWTQIANRFKEYDHHLIFETLNEPRLKGSTEEWSGGTAEGRDCINQYHQVSVDAIRATGSRNADRYLMISPYAASSIPVAIDGFVLPESTNLLVSIHNYYPYELCLGDNGKDWGSDADKQALDAEFDRIYQKFVANGIPVVLGEWANLNHSNTEDRIRHAAYYVSGCLSKGFCPIWWDNGDSNEFGIINRNTMQWMFPDIANAIVSANN